MTSASLHQGENYPKIHCSIVIGSSYREYFVTLDRFNVLFEYGPLECEKQNYTKALTFTYNINTGKRGSWPITRSPGRPRMP